MLGTVLLVILILLLIGALPRWGITRAGIPDGQVNGIPHQAHLDRFPIRLLLLAVISMSRRFYPVKRLDKPSAPRDPPVALTDQLLRVDG